MTLVKFECAGCADMYEYEHIGGRRRKWCDECVKIPVNKRYGYANANTVVTCQCGTTFRTRNHVQCRSCREPLLSRMHEISPIRCSQCPKFLTNRQVYDALKYQERKPSAKEMYCSTSCAYSSVRLPPGEYARRERERMNAKNRRRRAEKYATRTEPYTREWIFERDGHTCQICFNDVDMTLSGLDTWGPTIDHTIPLVRGGTDTPDNVTLAHRFCNLSKHDRILV